MARKIKKTEFLVILLIVLLGGFLRFYKLDWGEGFFFHPDEYHIVNSVNQLSFPDQMNPNFFSYGSFTVYLIYFTKLFLTTIGTEITYPATFLLGRFYSALFSTLTVFVVYQISKSIFKKRYLKVLATFLVAILPGLIQQAHYATPESSLTFWLFLTLHLWIKFLKKRATSDLYLSGLTIGIALSVKIVAATFLSGFALIFFIKSFLMEEEILVILKKIVTTLFIAVATFAAIFPYSILDWKNFRHSVDYETSLAQGDPLVFYTRQFSETYPILFQFEKILPYTLGPVVVATGSAGFFCLLFTIFKKVLKKKTRPMDDVLIGKEKEGWFSFNIKSKKNIGTYLLFTVVFFCYFIPNAFLFTKWTRFIAPSFPFWAIFSVILIDSISRYKKLAMGLAAFVVISTSVWASMFFSVYINDDVRVKATKWISENIAQSEFILTETRNMLEVPLTGGYQKLAFDFYELDQDSSLLPNLVHNLETSDYFIIQTRRIYKNHLRFPEKYPLVNSFYKNLFNGSLGFFEVAEFTSYPQISLGKISLEIPDENAEETWSVFDHPRIIVYKNEKRLQSEEILATLKSR